VSLYEEEDSEPPCERCYVPLDDSNAMVYGLYTLVRNQVRMTSMGDIVDLDYRAVLEVIKLYVAADELKKTFERVLQCFYIERGLAE
jgi:hypothetical protein